MRSRSSPSLPLPVSAAAPGACSRSYSQPPPPLPLSCYQAKSDPCRRSLPSRSLHQPGIHPAQPRANSTNSSTAVVHQPHLRLAALEGGAAWRRPNLCMHPHVMVLTGYAMFPPHGCPPLAPNLLVPCRKLFPGWVACQAAARLPHWHLCSETPWNTIHRNRRSIHGGPVSTPRSRARAPMRCGSFASAGAAYMVTRLTRLPV